VVRARLSIKIYIRCIICGTTNRKEKTSVKNKVERKIVVKSRDVISYRLIK